MMLTLGLLVLVLPLASALNLLNADSSMAVVRRHVRTVEISAVVAAIMVFMHLWTEVDIRSPWFTWLHWDGVGITVFGYVLGLSALVQRFSLRYMWSEKEYAAFFRRMTLLALFAVLTWLATDIRLTLVSWAASLFLLTRLLRHHRDWAAAKASARIAGLSFLFSWTAFAAALLTLAWYTGSWEGARIVAALPQVPAEARFIAATLLILSAISQSALWPFQRWLLVSQTAPTPVSAFMHAGLINAGALILLRWGDVLSGQLLLLAALTAIGAYTAAIGMLMMVVQSDFKRNLTCSTSAQMGFMLMQCGLGHFVAAVTHMMLHGLFKSNLFLGAGQGLQIPAARHEKGVARVQAGVLGVLLVAGLGQLLVGQSPNWSLIIAAMAVLQAIATWTQSGRPLNWALGITVFALSALGYLIMHWLLEFMLEPVPVIEVPLIFDWGVFFALTALGLVQVLAHSHHFTRSDLGRWLYMKLLYAGVPPLSAWSFIPRPRSVRRERPALLAPVLEKEKK